jgi:glyoxylase-like metal-dependent hydrolase (beta-lactamase superfamily II)
MAGVMGSDKASDRASDRASVMKRFDGARVRTHAEFRMETRSMDGSLAADAAADSRAPLAYPFADQPRLSPGEAFEVAPGVFRLRLGLPFALDHINVWALRDGDAWTVVDTGLNMPAAIAAWETALAGPLEGRPVRRVVVTHMHPDHVGLAGWFVRTFRCPLHMTRLEYVVCRMLAADTGRPAPEEAIDFYRAAGWSEPQLDAFRARFGGFGRGVQPMPDSFRRLEDGDRLVVDGAPWRVVIGCGHSPEHACLLREADKVFISGDQVLPKISSNVSVWPTEPEADPLGDWLSSLQKLEHEVPADALVLPSHGEPFLGVHDRLQALARGHERSLERLLRTLAEPRRVVETFGALFARPVGDDLVGMATGEALAHLNHLKRRGLVEAEPAADGVTLWRARA